MSKHSILQLPLDNYIAYHKTEGKQNKPTVIFLGGFMSDMTGTKATALEKFCIYETYSFIRFDYIGHGQSSGKFTDGTISLWKDNVLSVIDNLSQGPVVLIGSSMGGWLMLLAALERPERVVGLIGVASAPDFTEILIWEKMSDAEKKIMREKGVFNLKSCKPVIKARLGEQGEEGVNVVKPTCAPISRSTTTYCEDNGLASEYGEAPYPITMNLIEDGRKHLLLQNKININCPVRLLHGMQDMDVPCQLSIKLSEQLTTDNMCLNLIQNGDHRLSEPDDLELLCTTLKEMIERF